MLSGFREIGDLARWVRVNFDFRIREARPDASRVPSGLPLPFLSRLRSVRSLHPAPFAPGLLGVCVFGSHMPPWRHGLSAAPSTETHAETLKTASCLVLASQVAGRRAASCLGPYMETAWMALATYLTLAVVMPAIEILPSLVM